jgi:hypothetical protein
MVEFKKNVKELLPYNRKKYISRTNWYGVSFQLPGVFEGKKIGLEKFVEVYENWFENIVSQLDNGSFWIVNHDRQDFEWFPKEGTYLINLRTLFKQNDISNTFKGAIIFTKNDLLKFSKDLISYPNAVLHEESLKYENLDVSHSVLPIIIKISAHWDISLLSTDESFLKKLVYANSRNDLILKPYRGTSL